MKRAAAILAGATLFAAILTLRTCGDAEKPTASPPPSPPREAPLPPTTPDPSPPVIPAPPPTAAPTSAVAAPPAPPPKPARGRISGVVRLAGERPKTRLIRMDADPVCRAAYEDAPPAEDLVVGPNGELQWAFVWIRKGHQGILRTPSSTKPLIQLVGCRFTPRVVGVRLDEPVVFVGRDETPHVLLGQSIFNPGFQMDLLRPGQESRKDFIVPEVMLKVGCQVHAWERAWIGVLDHPFFAVTDAEGRYAIAGLPEGTYEVGAWHEKTPVESVEVGVGLFGNDASQNFELRLAAGER